MMSIIDKVAWLIIKNRKVLLVRSRGKDVFYFPGGKREGTESDTQTLTREIKEELGVDLIPDTIKYLQTFKAQAHGKEEGIFVEEKYYLADYLGTLQPMMEIEELAWLFSKDTKKVSAMGELVFGWLKDEDLID